VNAGERTFMAVSHHSRRTRRKIDQVQARVQVV
jgi:hypothetical protein